MGVCQVAMGGKAKEGFQQKRPLECWEAMGRFGESFNPAAADVN